MDPEMRPYLTLIAPLLRCELIPAKSKRTIRQGQQAIHRARAAHLSQIIEQHRFKFRGMSVRVDDWMVELFPDKSRPRFACDCHKPASVKISSAFTSTGNKPKRNPPGGCMAADMGDTF